MRNTSVRNALIIHARVVRRDLLSRHTNPDAQERITAYFGKVLSALEHSSDRSHDEFYGSDVHGDKEALYDVLMQRRRMYVSGINLRQNGLVY